MKNLDYEPGFWITVLMILPFMVTAEVIIRIENWKNENYKTRNRS